MKYSNWAALGGLAVIAYFGNDVSAFAQDRPLGVPVPLAGATPLAAAAVVLVGGGFLWLRRMFR